MAEKKQKQSVKSIYKILAVVGCVLFVVLMILSSMGSSWITAFTAVKPGDTVTIDYTIWDREGNPLLTSNQQLYTQITGAGGNIFYSKQLVLQANQTSTKALIPIPIYTATKGWSMSFALFGGEHDAITSALVGMKHNEQKTIAIPFNEKMDQYWSAAQLGQQGYNLTEAKVGDKIAMGVSANSALSKNATESDYSVRFGEITGLSPDGATINFGYPKIDVNVIAINNR